MFLYIADIIFPRRARNATKTNIIRLLDLKYIFYIYIIIRDIKFNGNIPLEIYYLLLLGNKIRYIYYKYINIYNKYNIINLIFF